MRQEQNDPNAEIRSMLQSIMAAMEASGDLPLNPGGGGGEGEQGGSLFQSKSSERGGAAAGGGRSMSPKTLNGERAEDAAYRASNILKALIRSDEDKKYNAEMAWRKEQDYSVFNGKDQIHSSLGPRSSTPQLLSQSPGHKPSMKADVVLGPAQPRDKTKTRGGGEGGGGGGVVHTFIMGPDGK